MSIEYTDAGGPDPSLKKEFQGLSIGDVSVSVSENEKIIPKPGHQLVEGHNGDCYIFNYEQFKKTGSTRPGSENDVERLRHDFKALKFNVYCGEGFTNLTKEKTKAALKNAAEKDHTQSKYFVCIFLTHGDEGKLLMFDEYIKIDKILQYFSRSACKSLAGKPKIFIFQACRGSCCEEGVLIDSANFNSVKDIEENTNLDGNLPSSSQASHDYYCEEEIEAVCKEGLPTDSANFDSDKDNPENPHPNGNLVSSPQASDHSCFEEEMAIYSADSGSLKDNPDYLDFLIAYSTYKGTYSFKTKDPEWNYHNHGSYFIDELCRTIEQFSDKLDLLQILTVTNYRVAYLFESLKTKDPNYRYKKQMPVFTSRLRTEVKFNKIQGFESPHTKYFDYRRKKTRLGFESTECPLKDRKLYSIQNCKKIQFLSLINTGGNFDQDLTRCVTRLWLSLAKKGYQREEKRNWSKTDLINFLKLVAGRNFSSTDCLICFIACQAKGDYLYDKSGKKFKMQEIIEQFTGEKCLSLVQKPKIFIFLLYSPAKKSWFPCISAHSSDGDSKIPIHSDILDIAITIQDSQQLAVAIEKIRGILVGESSEDFLSLLTRMNNELVEDHGFHSLLNNNLATFCFNSTLTKTLILNNTKSKTN